MAVRYFEVVVFVFGRKKKKRGRGDQRDNPTWPEYNNILPLGARKPR